MPDDWLSAYVAHAPRAVAVVAGPDHAVCAANAAFRRVCDVMLPVDAPAAGASDAAGPAFGVAVTRGWAASPTHALHRLLDRAQRTGTAAHGVLSAGGGDADLWECTAWAPADPPHAARLVVELVPAGDAERAGARARDVNEQLLLTALREHGLAEDAEVARRVVEARVAERTAELAHANAALAAEAAERAQMEAARNALRRELAGAEEAERRRLARDLHDRLGQHLTALALGLEDARRSVPPAAAVGARLTQLQALAAALTRDARALALELRPPELDDVGLDHALATYVREWSARYGVAAEVEATGIDAGARALPGEVATALYRIAQEALTNVARHAGAHHVSVIVEAPDGEVRLVVEDDGRGFDPEATAVRARAERRLGLAGMRERAALAGGTLTLESSPGGGTALYVRIPDVRIPVVDA